MEWTNYHHLLYFWMVCREGTVARAAAKLGLAQQTVSGQIRQFEDALGERLFERAGRRLQPTDAGRIVHGYADDIFALGQEMREALRGRVTGRTQRLAVGVADVLPKLIASLLLQPALRAGIHVVVREARAEDLLARLAVHDLDLVLTDSPLPPTVKVRAFQHLLGESGISIFAARKLAARRRKPFPQLLDGAPFLMPAERTSLRHSLDEWFERHAIRPHIVGEFDDSALVKTFGEHGFGYFAAPSVVADHVRKQHRVASIGDLEDARERFYALTLQRRVTHPAIAAISRAARLEIFA